MYDDVKAANTNDWNLQKSIQSFGKRKVSPENRPIKLFPKFNLLNRQFHDLYFRTHYFFNNFTIKAAKGNKIVLGITFCCLLILLWWVIFNRTIFTIKAAKGNKIF